MGLFDSISKIGRIADPFTNSIMENQIGGQFGELGQVVADPLDLLGVRAEQTRDAISSILMGSAEAGIQSQREMLDRVNELLGPYREAVVSQLPNYTAMATGGEAQQVPLAPQYKLETQRGQTAIDRMLAAKGAYGSSGRGAMLSEMLLNAGQNEAARRYGMNLDLQRLGTGAIGQLGQAGRQAGSNVSGIYGNLGSGLNTAMQNYGAQRQQSMNQGANALYGLARYLQG